MTAHDTRNRLARAVRAYPGLGAGGGPTAVEATVTLLALAVMYTTTTVRTGATEFPGAALTLVVVATWAPLLLRTRRPALALLGTLAGETCVLVFLAVPDGQAVGTGGMGAYQPVPLATMVAVATLAARVPRRAGWTAGLVAGGYLMLVGVARGSSATFLTDLVVFYLVVTAAGVGVWRYGRLERARRAEERRRAAAQEAVLDERLRIARELHDVLAHDLTLVNAQAGVAKYLLRRDVDAAEQALGDITQHTARAIDDLRATLRLLRDQGAGSGDTGAGADGSLRPVPGLADLDRAVAALRAAGATVDLTESGTREPLPQHLDLAAFRIVQESMTNATKHAPRAAVDVALAWAPTGVRIRVTNPVDPDPHRESAPGTGHGLIGMRERATSVGGTFRAGPTPDGRFEVVATLPLPAGRTPAAPTAPAAADDHGAPTAPAPEGPLT